jgi:UDP-N-acetylmuramyl pentapeptide synthase
MAASVADEVLLLGDNMRAAHLKTGQGKHFGNHEGIAEYIDNSTQSSAILVKGSRGMKMEKVVNILLGR